MVSIPDVHIIFPKDIIYQHVQHRDTPFFPPWRPCFSAACFNIAMTRACPESDLGWEKWLAWTIRTNKCVYVNIVHENKRTNYVK